MFYIDLRCWDLSPHFLLHLWIKNSLTRWGMWRHRILPIFDIIIIIEVVHKLLCIFQQVICLTSVSRGWVLRQEDGSHMLLIFDHLREAGLVHQIWANAIAGTHLLGCSNVHGHRFYVHEQLATRGVFIIIIIIFKHTPGTYDWILGLQVCIVFFVAHLRTLFVVTIWLPFEVSPVKIQKCHVW